MTRSRKYFCKFTCMSLAFFPGSALPSALFLFSALRFSSLSFLFDALGSGSEVIFCAAAFFSFSVWNHVLAGFAYISASCSIIFSALVTSISAFLNCRSSFSSCIVAKTKNTNSKGLCRLYTAIHIQHFCKLWSKCLPPEIRSAQCLVAPTGMIKSRTRCSLHVNTLRHFL